MIVKTDGSFAALVSTFRDEKISGGLRADGEEHQLEDGGEDCDAEEVGPALVRAEQVVHAEHLARQQPHRHGQLVDGAEAAAEVERRDLGYVHGDQTRVQTCSSSTLDTCRLSTFIYFRRVNKCSVPSINFRCKYYLIL